jgi:periplasmic divalent cation tolerance protein
MGKQDGYCTVITTCGSRDEAETLATGIIEQRLGACAQIDEIQSCYTWKDALSRDTEYRIMIKTRCALYDELEEYIRSRHCYDVPEIIAMPIEQGLAEYLSWIDETTGGAQ